MQYTVNDKVSVCGAIIAIIQRVIIPFIIIKHIALHMSTPDCQLLLPCCVTPNIRWAISMPCSLRTGVQTSLPIRADENSLNLPNAHAEGRWVMRQAEQMQSQALAMQPPDNSRHHLENHLHPPL